MCLLLLASAPIASESPVLVHDQRYAMGTMFDIVVYHPSRDEAKRTIGKAMDEIVRLDAILSHFKPDSDLSVLVRNGRFRSVAVHPALYEVLQQSLLVSRASHGRFDVTIAPLLRLWKGARERRQIPTAAEIAGARRCVGYGKIDASEPGRIQLRSDCVEIDLGGIGKGYAVDRALAILKDAGIRHAVVNAGGSSIGALGGPPSNVSGWPVKVGRDDVRSRTLWLRDTSMSTSEQNGEILDPGFGAARPASETAIVTGASATLADALSTALVLLSIDDGKKLLSGFPGMSAMWVAGGEVRATHGEPPPCR
jgi:thiamine biosynthesis lipoprotein